MGDDDRGTAQRPRTKHIPEVMDLMLEIANRVRALREERGYSMRELARRCDVNLRAIQRIEGAEGDVQVGTLLMLAKQLDVPLEDLIKQ